ncbi:MAG: adenylate/guanylate cyclase domain-containing protein [Spirulina sp. SIO3F2]|nr:adenylate/guanylate cyclase domain-containing protein [Spirulina sp. SIO3F2]
MSVPGWFWRWRGVWVTAPAVTLLVLGLRYWGLLEGWELAAYDVLLRSRPQPTQLDDRIGIVTIDEADLTAVGQGLVPDQALAQTIRAIAAQNPKLIGLDLYRDLPIPPGTAALTTAFKEIPNLVGIQKVASPAIAPPPDLPPERVAANDLVWDDDNRVRRAWLYLYDAEGNEYYGFGLYLALWLLEDQGIGFEMIRNGRDRLGAAIFEPFRSFDGGYIRADQSGYQTLINYRGAGQQFPNLPLRTILQGELPEDWATDKIILIGTTAESLNDYFLTPYSAGAGPNPVPLFGVEIQAQIIAQVLDAAYGDRPLIRPLAEPLEILWITLWGVIGAIAAWGWRFGIYTTANRSAPTLSSGLQQLLLPTTGVTLLWGVAYGALVQWGLWVPVVPTTLTFLGAIVGIRLYLANQAAGLRHTFGRYLSNEIVSTLLDQPGGLQLGGVRQRVTILTSDLRGFTALSERLPPEDVVRVLNIYLKVMMQVVTDYQGTINEIMGDGLLIFFGAPTPRADDPQRAIACALAMQLAMPQVNQELQHHNFPSLEMGIGINTGECVIGNLGSELHTKYSAVGAQVNLTFRIESYTTGQQILVSESVLATLDRGQLRIDGSRIVHPKGVKQSITIYEVGGMTVPYSLALPKIAEKFVQLSEPLSLLYVPLVGKHIKEDFFKGQLVQLSARGGKIRSESGEPAPAPFTNLKLNLVKLTNAPEISDDIYAKVQDTPSADDSFFVHFTAKPPAIAALFLRLLSRDLSSS